MNKGMILLVHGSRDPEWIRPFEKLADEVRRKAKGALVELACLQFSTPTIQEAMLELAKKGADQILVVPVFISALGHVLKDVPVAVTEVKKQHPELVIKVSPALGELPEVRAAFIRGILGLTC